MKYYRIWMTLCAGLALFGTTPILAQWTTQTVQLRPGWNAVYLEVQPEPRESDFVLAGLPVESVWRYNKQFVTTQFIQDPNELLQEPEAWLVWVPPSHPLTRFFSLYTIEGGLPYLIKTTNTTTFNWSIRGRPIQRQIEWLPNALNLVGFRLPASMTPTFQDFFAGAVGFTNPALYRLDSQGRWVITATSTTMKQGEAFWVRSQGLPTFQGPIPIQLSRRVGLEFGRILTEQTFSIYNASPISRTIIIRQLPSEAPPADACTALAGEVPLSYWQNDFTNNRVGWTNFPALLQSNVPPDGTWELRLAVRRRDMTAFILPSAATNSLYQSILEITDTAGLSRQLIPVTAEGIQSYAISTQAKSGFGAAGAGSQTHLRTGLWIGCATIDHVNQPPSSVPEPTATDFSFRLIIHVDAAGQARLLQKVLQMWLPGTYRLADDGTANWVVDQPGRFVLLTDDRLIPEFTGAAIREGQPVARRFSSAAFSFREPILMIASGDFGANNSLLAATVLLPFNDPLNPLVHAYHPDHNNTDDRGQELDTHKDHNLSYTSESWSVQRVISLQFTDANPNNQEMAGWQDTRLGGVYQETITGLHKSPLVVKGNFVLHSASEIATLNNEIYHQP